MIMKAIICTPRRASGFIFGGQLLRNWAKNKKYGNSRSMTLVGIMRTSTYRLRL
jgi:hypothetical protein